MNSLPSEILYDILTRLPQRSAAIHCSVVCKKWKSIILQPSFYSTVDIYSLDQYNKLSLFANLSNLNIYNDPNVKPIGHYIKHLVFHINCLLIEERIVDFKPFPYLQTIRGLNVDELVSEAVKCAYLQLQQPTHISYWYIDEDWITMFYNVKDNLKSLDVHVTPALLSYIPQHKEKQLYSPIYLDDDPIRSTHDNNQIIYSLKLILPTLSNLTELTFYCRQHIYTSEEIYNIDDHTLESIHASCPHLETLTLDKFIMNTSHQFANTLSVSLPANHLKNLNLKGHINHPLCYYYFSLKYTQLESLSLFLFYDHRLNGSNSLFSKYIYNMFFNMNLLKSISIDFFNTRSLTTLTRASITVATASSIGNVKEPPVLWPHYHFLICLYEKAHQMNHINYPFSLTIDEQEKDTLLNRIPDLTKPMIDDFLLQQYNPPILDHINSLSLRLDHAIRLVSIHLLNKNKNKSVILSTCLKELKINQQPDSTSINSLYINDWFILFPNLASFKLYDIPDVIDEDDIVQDITTSTTIAYKEDDDDYDYTGKGQHMNSTRLHQFIKRRQQIQSYYPSYYKLERLEIDGSRIDFKNGFNEFIKKCQRLKYLKINKMKHIISKNDIVTYDLQEEQRRRWTNCFPPEKYPHITLDLTHLYLKSLHIYQWTHIISNEDEPYQYTIYPVTELKLDESTSNQTHYVKKNIPIRTNLKSTLHIKCKGIDGVTFN